MQSNNKKKAKKPIIVTKPYLTGSPVDENTPKSALGFFGALVVMMVLFLLLGAILMFDNASMRIAANGIMIVLCLLMFFYYGISAGTQAVNHGEIMHTRQETGREVTARELSRSYHPAKGLLIALFGTIPLFLCAAILALLATRQMSGIGVLPSWISSLSETRAQLGEPIAFYSVSDPFTLETAMRLVIRMAAMPWVNIFDSTNGDNMLLMERLSPLLVLLPAMAYGLGYTRGPGSRTRVHSEIEEAKRKRARRSRKNAKKNQQRKQPRTPKGPEQLN